MNKVSVLEYKGGTIEYSDVGKGKTIVFLHGFLESKDIWTKFSKDLSLRYRVITINLPGHGNSSNFGYCHSMEFMADCVLSVLKSLKIRLFHLIGHSMGGYVSMVLAEKKPDNIRGLCLFHSTADNDSDEKKKERKKVIKVVQKNKSVFIKTAIPNLFYESHKSYKQTINRLVKSAEKMSTQAIIAAIEGMIIRSNQEIVLKFAPYPVLYIIGKNDTMLSWKKLVKESELNENSSRLLLEKTGHMGFFEEEEICLNSIKTWLKKGQL